MQVHSLYRLRFAAINRVIERIVSTATSPNQTMKRTWRDFLLPGGANVTAIGNEIEDGWGQTSPDVVSSTSWMIVQEPLKNLCRDATQCVYCWYSSAKLAQHHANVSGVWFNRSQTIARAASSLVPCCTCAILCRFKNGSLLVSAKGAPFVLRRRRCE